MASHVKRILLIEDDEQIRDFFDEVLTTAGYRVESVAAVTEGRTHLTEQAWDLLIADYRLKDGTGIAVANEAAARGIRTAIISGYIFQVSPEDAHRHDFLMKPIRAAELLQAVEQRIGAA